MRNVLALVTIVCFSLSSGAWAADVTVSKPGGGGQHATVQAGINAALGGTVTILDSQVYVEDVFIDIRQGHAGTTLRSAAGQRPTIRAANLVPARDIYQMIGIGLTNPPTPDRMGLSVFAPCTIDGINIENLDGQTNVSAAFGPLTACATAIHAPGAVIRNCTIQGATSGFGPGDWATVLVVAWGNTAAGVTFENCEIRGGEYAFVNETFGRYIPGWTTSTLVANNCVISGAGTNIQTDGGDTMLTTCTIRDSLGDGIGCGGGRTVLTGCDILDNAGAGLVSSYNASFALPGNWPVVTATNCLLARNRGGGRDSSLRVDHGTVTVSRSIVCLPQNTSSIYMDDNTAGSPCILSMDFCDIYGPTQDIYYSDQDARQHPIRLTLTNSIMFGRNGFLNPSRGTSVTITLTSSTLAVTDVATSGPGITSTNVVNIVPYYLLPYSAARPGYRYTNANLNIGPGATDIGSQGRFIPLQPLSVRRSWILYR